MESKISIVKEDSPHAWLLGPAWAFSCGPLLVCVATESYYVIKQSLEGSQHAVQASLP